MRRPCSRRAGASRRHGARALAAAVRAQTPNDARTDEIARGPKARHRRGRSTSTSHDLEQKHLDAGVTTCGSLILEPFCLLSHSPTFEDRHYLDENEFRRDVAAHPAVLLEARLSRRPRSTRVVTHRADDRCNVTFNVHEGPPTLVRDVADQLRLDADQRQGAQPARRCCTRTIRSTWSRSTRCACSFQNELWDQGYGDAVVDTTVVVDTATRLADVALTLTPNRVTTVGRITVTGNAADRSDDDSATRSRSGRAICIGSPTMLESQRNLYESNLFRLAAIEVPTAARQRQERQHRRDRGAAARSATSARGSNNIDFSQFQAHYTAYNFFGGARRLDVDGDRRAICSRRRCRGAGHFRERRRRRAGQPNVSPFLQPTYNASIDFKQPAFLRRPGDAAAIGAFTHRTINPGVFIDHGYGGQVTFTHEVAIRAPASMNYRYEINRVEASDVYFCVNYGVCDTLTIGTLRSHQSLSPLTLTGFIDRSDAPFSPTKGYVARLDFEHASAFTLSDYRYNRLFFDAAVYGHRSGTRNVYSAHLRVGLVRAISPGPESGVLHPRKRFYAGGANSVRGLRRESAGSAHPDDRRLDAAARGDELRRRGLRADDRRGAVLRPNSPKPEQRRLHRTAAWRHVAARGERRVSRSAAARRDAPPFRRRGVHRRRRRRIR